MRSSFLVALAAAGLSALACGAPPIPSPEKSVLEGPAQAQEGPSVVLNTVLPARIYSDGLGTVLEFVPVKVEGSSLVHALVRIAGVDSPLVGVALLATRHLLAKGASEWRVKWDGSSRALIRSEAGSPGRDILFLHVPDISWRTKVVHDLAASRAVVGQEVLRAHQKALDTGRIAKLESFDRDAPLAHGKKRLAEETLKLEQACQAKFDVQMDWAVLPDSAVGYQTHCHRLLAKLADFCGRDENTKADVHAKARTIRCSNRDIGAPILFRAGGLVEASSHEYAAGEDDRLFGEMDSLLKLKPTVLKSSTGLVVAIDATKLSRIRVHLGWLPNLHEQRLKPNHNHHHLELWHGARHVLLKRKEGRRWLAGCPSKPIEFEEVSAEERHIALQNIQYEGRIWRHEPLALSRDGAGTYYYVDRLADSEGGLGHRLFRGPRGAVKPVKLLDVVGLGNDLVLVTRGERIELTFRDHEPEKMVSTRGKRSKTLQLLRLRQPATLDFLYNDLGAYEGEDYGGLCDLKPPKN